MLAFQMNEIVMSYFLHCETKFEGSLLLAVQMFTESFKFMPWILHSLVATYRAYVLVSRTKSKRNHVI